MRAYSVMICVALTGCNQIFGLNDPVGFVDAPPRMDAPAPVFGDCIVDSFDTLETGVWTRIDPSAGAFVDAIGGELSIDGASNAAGADGVISGRYGLDGGVIDVELTDSITQEFVFAVFEVRFDESETVLRISRDRLELIVTTSAPDFFASDGFPIDHRFWRVRHEPDLQVTMETSPDGIDYTLRGAALIGIVDLSAVTVSLKAEFSRDSASDRVAFDNFKLTGLCPP